MAFRFHVVPDVFDFPVGADQERAAHDSQERAAEEFLHASRSVRFDQLEFRIAEQRKVYFVFFLERGLRLHGIAAGAQDGYAQTIELLFCVTKLGRLDRST